MFGKQNTIIIMHDYQLIKIPPDGLWLGVIGLYCGLSEDGEFAFISARYGELAD